MRHRRAGSRLPARGDDVEREIQVSHGLHRSQDSSPAHVELHILHPGRRLYGDAARIEGHGLADEDDGRGVPTFLCSSTIKRGSLAADLPTVASPVRPSSSMPDLSRTVTSMPCLWAISRAFCARYSGVATLEGSLAKSRAREAPQAAFWPTSAPSMVCPRSFSSETSWKVSSS